MAAHHAACATGRLFDDSAVAGQQYLLLLTMLTFALCGSSASAAVANVVRFGQGDTIAVMSGGTLTVWNGIAGIG